ncbi:MAG: hypothetical protein IIA88_12365 [Bacteroidetes bacterium]|nr:hypothetical protein [Bacteroidota bacterium]
MNQVINEVIEKEISLGKYLSQNYSQKLKYFEKKYKIKTADFVKRFEKGDMGDKEDFFEWLAIFKGKKHWEDKLMNLTNYEDK